MMGETFKYVAPVAGALGYSVEDTATVIGVLANNGIKSSQAGTVLRKSINSLVAPSKKATTQMPKVDKQPCCTFKKGYYSDAEARFLCFRNYRYL